MIWLNPWLIAGVVLLVLLSIALPTLLVKRSVPAGERCILDLLASCGPLYGLDLVNLSNGVLKRGTVYVLLSRLQDRGLVAYTEPGSDGRRRYMLCPGRMPPSTSGGQ